MSASTPTTDPWLKIEPVLHMLDVEGTTLNSMAKAAGVTWHSLVRHLRRHGYEVNPRPYTPRGTTKAAAAVGAQAPVVVEKATWTAMRMADGTYTLEGAVLVSQGDTMIRLRDNPRVFTLDAAHSLDEAVEAIVTCALPAIEASLEAADLRATVTRKE